MKPWTRIYTPRRHGNGHKIERDPDGRISICDWSGIHSHQTDDGPLIVAPGTIVRVDYGDYGISYTVPVTVEREGRQGRASIDTDSMRALSEVVPVKVEYSPAFIALRDDVHFAGLLSPAFE